MGTVVRLSKQKWDIARRRCREAFSWPVEILGTDRHGTWLGSRQGTPVHQPDGGVELQQNAAVWLVIERSWSLPAFWFTAETDLTIDVCTPLTFEDETWSFIDLELDLFRRPDGRAGLVDQDEWDLLAGSGLIVDEAVRAAEETARSLLPLVERQVEPFGHAALPWLHGLDRSPQEGPKPGDLGLPAVAAGG
ncbi:DUF402 domain-containing protein [Serinicoccus sp. CUA-874]|uniref:DUF402 domain-containing protein n=1 Tax=Serinicoccus sp. CUA-874 TaxID=1517939 RepID=UPI001300E103|nr:DUF402 domain-containing protein [Serinicoccus sp. CUA-874]